MTQIDANSPTKRETHSERKGRVILIELHPRFMVLRAKGTQQSGTLDYQTAFESALMRSAKNAAGDVPSNSTGRRKAKGAEPPVLYPRPARVADGWLMEGRTANVLGPSIELRGISWTPLVWMENWNPGPDYKHDDGCSSEYSASCSCYDDEGTEDPTFHKTRGITFTDL